MFLSGEPDARSRDALQRLAGDEYAFRVRHGVLYYSYPRSLEGRRTIDFEKVLGMVDETGWRPVNRCVEIRCGSRVVCDARPWRVSFGSAYAVGTRAKTARRQGVWDACYRGKRGQARGRGGGGRPWG